MFKAFVKTVKEFLTDSIIYVLGSIIISIVNAGLALIVKNINSQYIPEIFFGLELDLVNLSFLYFIVFLIWYIIIKYLDKSIE